MVNYQMCILFYISLTTQAGVSSTKGGGIEYVDLITNFTPRFSDLPTALTGSVSVESSDEIWKKMKQLSPLRIFIWKVNTRYVDRK